MTVVVVNPWDIPPAKSKGTAVTLALLFGPLGMFYVSARMGWLSLLICIVAALLTLGLSILAQIVVLPIVAASEVGKANVRRAQMLAALEG